MSAIRTAAAAAAGCHHRGTALILGVANHRSIAWACAQSFLDANWNVILTYQSDRFESTIQKLVVAQQQEQEQRALILEQQENGGGNGSGGISGGRILASFPCNVAVDDELKRLFSEHVPSVLENNSNNNNNNENSSNNTLNALVHSVAYANFEKRPFSQASWQAYAEAQRISSYSFLQTAHLARPWMNASGSGDSNGSSSMTALTYLGATRAVPNYHIMGPAKASLEAIVRGLAMEFGNGCGSIPLITPTPPDGINDDDETSSSSSTTSSIIRVNAVSAGPLNTLAARGIPGFGGLHKTVSQQSPLGRAVTARQVADTVRFLAIDGTGITGQTITVDGGFQSIVPI